MSTLTVGGVPMTVISKSVHVRRSTDDTFRPLVAESHPPEQLAVGADSNTRRPPRPVMG
jgi:hypothetical protein